MLGVPGVLYGCLVFVEELSPILGRQVLQNLDRVIGVVVIEGKRSHLL